MFWSPCRHVPAPAEPAPRRGRRAQYRPTASVCSLQNPVSTSAGPERVSLFLILLLGAQACGCITSPGQATAVSAEQHNDQHNANAKQLISMKMV